MFARTASVSLRLPENGPPGATRMMKNEMVISANRVGIAPRIRRTDESEHDAESGLRPGRITAGPRAIAISRS